MPAEIKARVMRTADSLTHVNHLGVPSFGIKEFRLETSDGKKKSKAYLPAGHTAPAGGTDDFHFAPEKEKIVIHYTVNDPCHIITKATLELFVRFHNKPLWTSLLRRAEYTNGEHKLAWDGALKNAKAENFPDGYVTLEHSPYKLRLHLESESVAGDPALAWTYFHVLLKSIVIELGPVEMLPAAKLGDASHKRMKALTVAIKKAGGIPPASASNARKVFLISNLFKTANGEMNTNKAFEVYRHMWRSGPDIPLVAKIRLADSNDKPVNTENGPGAKALGYTRFLWDWEDVPENVNARQSQAKPKAFLNAAIDYYKDNTLVHNKYLARWIRQPKGDNCHVDRGGKRGDTTFSVFPGFVGYSAKPKLKMGKFPFRVDPCKNRMWAAFSQPWRKGALMGKTGAIFQPSRMAGDAYKVTVYLANDMVVRSFLGGAEHTLDMVNDAPLPANAAAMQSTGPLEIWRELHLVRYIRKVNAIADFVAANLAQIRRGYAEAYIQVNNLTKASDKYLMADHRGIGGAALDYNKVCEDAMVATGQAMFVNHLAAANNEDHLGDASMFKVRSHNDFKTAVTNWFQTLFPFLAPGPISMAVNNWLNSEGVETAVKYCNKLSSVLPYTKVMSDLTTLKGGKQGVGTPAPDGITIVQFDHLHSTTRTLVAAGTGGITVLLGAAIAVTDATRNTCVFLFFSPDVDTFIHEVGHHLFLPHSRHHVGETVVPAGAQDDRHDDDDDHCIMSYSTNSTAFCGLCQLRMRGWDAEQLKKNDADNKKP